MEKLLLNQTALITGGAGEMAQTIACTLAAHGANIVVADVNLEGANAVAAKLSQAFGVRAQGYYLDVTDCQGHSAFVAQVEEEIAPLDILVNIAGIASTVQYKDITEQDWDKLMSINLKGPFFLTRDIFFKMKERKKGRIINLGSISGERGARYAGPHYSISKAGLICLTKVLALQAEDTGVTANTISPGIIASKMTSNLGSQIFSYDVPMDRMGTPQDIANAVLYLASDLASYVTGQNLSVNGGQSMR